VVSNVLPRLALSARLAGDALQSLPWVKKCKRGQRVTTAQKERIIFVTLLVTML
jgi:hypothetical protein